MKVLFFLFFTGLAIGARAQTVPVDTTAVPADETQAARSTFTLGAMYMNNASYYGQKSVEKTPYVALVASYRHKSGFYLNGLAYRLLNDSSRLASAYGVGAGYEFSLAKNLKADLSYGYSFYPSLSPFLQAANPHNANLTITRTGWLNASVGVDYAFGQTNDVFATAGISKEITLFSPGENDVITLTPAFDVSAGTQRFFEYYVEEKRTRDSVLGLPFIPIFGGNGNGNGIGNGNGNGGGNGGGTTTTTTTTTKTRFDLLSYNLKLPLAYSRAHYTLEVACQLSLLGNKAQTGSGDLNSFISASFYYQF